MLIVSSGQLSSSTSICLKARARSNLVKDTPPARVDTSSAVGSGKVFGHNCGFIVTLKSAQILMTPSYSAPVSTSKSMSQPLSLRFVISFLYRLLESTLWISTPVASSSQKDCPDCLSQLLQGAFYPSCLYFHSFCRFGCPCTLVQYVPSYRNYCISCSYGNSNLSCAQSPHNDNMNIGVP